LVRHRQAERRRSPLPARRVGIAAALVAAAGARRAATLGWETVLMGAGHSHGPASSAGGAYRGRLLVVLAVTSAVLVAEVVGGILTGSLALLADAGHMFTDVAGLGVAILAVTFAAKAPRVQRTYGYYRLEILAAVVNGLLLFGIAVLILIEA
jgi:cobalt-zinc-cadmium efflux system protein